MMWQVIDTMSLKPDNHYINCYSHSSWKGKLPIPVRHQQFSCSREHQSPLEGLLENRLLCSALAGSDSGSYPRA